MSPWEARINYEKCTLSTETDATKTFLTEDRLLIATVVAANKHDIAYGIAQASRYSWTTTGMRLGSRKIQDPYTTELQAIAAVLKCVERGLTSNLRILLTTSSLPVLQVLNKPARQSGQRAIASIYRSKNEIEKRGIRIEWQWVPISTPFSIRDRAKEEARKALKRDTSEHQWAATTSVLSQLRPLLLRKRELPHGVGKASQELDTALPGKHTKAIYDSLKKKDARIIVQLRTGCARLNQFLARIRAVESPICQCGAAPESIRHFLFSCSRWTTQRKKMYDKWPGKEGDVRFFTGSKSATDTAAWRPELEAIQTVIEYVRATTRFEMATG